MVWLDGVTPVTWKNSRLRDASPIVRGQTENGEATMGAKARMQRLLVEIYGIDRAPEAQARLTPLIQKAGATSPPPAQPAYFCEKDIVLITYGDSLISAAEKPLASMHRFAGRYLAGAVSTIHFLPFFPYSSDDGFAVQDFFRVAPGLGEWEDLQAIGRNFDLMFDFVINHFSSQNEWLDRYLAGEAGFENLAIAVDPGEDLTGVTRPRSLPLLTEFERRDGEKVHLWTTFSEDQIDFNFKSINVLEKMVSVMLWYVRRGARILRLDAIAYLWKEIGTACIHLPQTHAMVKLLRAILDQVAPNVLLITETNVPHDQNISYFGQGTDEAQLVYNFSLPPLLLHAFLKSDTTVLSDWARGLTTPSDRTTYFNFTASHDGIGVRPLEGILPPAEMNGVVEAVRRAGGRVSTKRNADGSDSPYELNITYVDAILADPSSSSAEKFLASQAIQYCLPGVPATYIHSLLGSRNWTEGVNQTGRARTINREKLSLSEVMAALNDSHSFRSRVFYPYLRLMRIRSKQPAFHPNAAFEIFDLGPALFAIRRWFGRQTIFAVTNISSRPVPFDLKAMAVPRDAIDLITGQKWDFSISKLAPFQYVWLSSPPPPG
jgi:sucrose phosphorylase